MEHFREVKPGKQIFKRGYLAIMLWYVGRAIQATAKVDEEVKSEFEALPDQFTFALTAFPDGPSMVVGKTEDGKVSYMGGSLEDNKVDVKMTLKSVEHLFLLFTFQESTPVANSRDRMFVDGGLSEACAVVRVLDIVQVYLLPKVVAKLAIKRYPRWTWKRHIIDRLKVNVRTIIGL